MSINPILNKKIFSTLNCKNIIINKDEELSTNVNETDSNIIADENLYVNTNNLNVKASQDIFNSSKEAKEKGVK